MLFIVLAKPICSQQRYSQISLDIGQHNYGQNRTNGGGGIHSSSSTSTSPEITDLTTSAAADGVADAPIEDKGESNDKNGKSYGASSTASAATATS